MSEYYYVVLGFLALLACIDLFVGVSNDAVNFLNSAIGSRIASFRTTMWVASMGVLLGCTFSSGMMEIARSGVFHPQMFTFAEIMTIFLAVMIADVLLLDAFNSMGLPTSTTVSIVFELLGSALAAALYKIYLDSGSFSEVVAYINSAKALTIISGILISVVVAFISGMVVQYITRLVFTFHFENMYRRVGGIFGGIAITAIFYFLIVKGAKNASFMRPEWVAWVHENSQSLLLWMFIGLSVILQACITFFKANIFKLVILSGTFSLAFAFAGNDLVNFVGVPLAAFDAVRDFLVNGTDPDTYMMSRLKEGSQAPTYLLVLAGLIMVATLWFSKKAHRVVRTSINLSSSQSGEHEQFGSSLPGRMIVRSSITVGEIIRQIIPMRVQNAINSRFTPRELKRDELPLPFDYVRASVNLVLSSILIASATSLQLPLSTTYVTFMVAMGSSFADGAWDRESAVYRISGVLTVISGWFMTALTACTMAGITCLLINIGGELMALALALLVLTLLIRSNFLNNKDQTSDEIGIQGDDHNSVRDTINANVGVHLATSVQLFDATINAMFDDNEPALRQLKVQAAGFYDRLSQERSVYYSMAQSRRNDTKLDRDARYCYFRAYTNMREVGRNLQRLTLVVKDHVANRHRVATGTLKDNLLSLSTQLQKLILNPEGRHSLETLKLHSNDIVAEIDRLQEEMMSSLSGSNISMRNCELYLSCLQFARELVSRYSIVGVLQKELNELCDLAGTGQVKTLHIPNIGETRSLAPKRILQALHVTTGTPQKKSESAKSEESDKPSDHTTTPPTP